MSRLAPVPNRRVADEAAMPEWYDGSMDMTNPNWFLKARLKTRQLLLLIALDDYRNIHRAADELHMTQPAASKQVKDLEEMLGVRLFERLPRGMAPTIYGETMIRHARMALNSLALAHDDIAMLKAGLTGQVEVGVIMTPAMALLPRAIAKVKQQAPLLRIGVQVESSSLLLDRLQRGELDFMIGRIVDSRAIASLAYEELTEEPACAVARPGHPLLERASLTLADIAPLPWILPPHDSILRYRFDMMFRRAGLAPPADSVDTTAMLLITALLQQTDSLHVMPLEVARYYELLSVVRILPIELPCKMDAFGIIRQQDRLLSPGAELLLRTVRATAAESA
jgi:DNA-binding transcriptional LysR family regulator